MNPTEQLKRFFENFPGIGPRQAGRFIYHLFNMEPEQRNQLANLIANIDNHISQCQECMRFFRKNTNSRDNSLCMICSNPNRDSAKLMIVAYDQDIKQIEDAGYDGVYFVLGGLLKLVHKKQPSIRTDKLIKKLEQKSFDEIIFALPATTDGDYTLDTIKKQILDKLPQYKDKLSLLGRGLATGTEIEYADTQTIKHALKNKEKLI